MFPSLGGERLVWTSEVVLPSFHAPHLSSRDHSFAAPRPRGLGKVDTIPSIQGQSQGIPSTGMNDLRTGTDQRQPHQSQSLNVSCNYGGRACLQMKGTHRKAELNLLLSFLYVIEGQVQRAGSHQENRKHTSSPRAPLAGLMCCPHLYVRGRRHWTFTRSLVSHCHQAVDLSGPGSL